MTKDRAGELGVAQIKAHIENRNFNPVAIEALVGTLHAVRPHVTLRAM